MVKKSNIGGVFMQPIISEKIHMDEKGQIAIPRSILDLYEIRDATEFKIQLLPDGTIQLIPTLPFPKSFYMESSQELTENAAKAYLQGRDKKYVSDKEIDDLLKD